MNECRHTQPRSRTDTAPYFQPCQACSREDLSQLERHRLGFRFSTFPQGWQLRSTHRICWNRRYKKTKKNKHKNKLFGLLGQQIKTDLYTVVSRKIILQSQKSVWTCDVTCTKSIFWKILLCSTNVSTFDLVQTNEV